jgi:hypothetical protein
MDELHQLAYLGSNWRSLGAPFSLLESIACGGSLTQAPGYPLRKDHWRTTGAGSSRASGWPSGPGASRFDSPERRPEPLRLRVSTSVSPYGGADHQTARRGAANTSAVPPVIDPARFEDFPTFRETFLSFIVGAEANTTVRRFGDLLYNLVLEYWQYWPDQPEGQLRASLRAAVADMRHVQGFLAEWAAPETDHKNPHEEHLAKVGADVARDLAALADRRSWGRGGVKSSPPRSGDEAMAWPKMVS